MKTAIKYRVSTNRVMGHLEASNDALLATQLSSLMPDTGGIEVDSDHDAIRNPDKWRVSSGVLQAKTVLVISADKSQILADGIDEATITISPATALDVSVDDNAIALTSGESLIITSDTPKTFRVFIDHIDYYADPILIKAA